MIIRKAKIRKSLTGCVTMLMNTKSTGMAMCTSYYMRETRRLTKSTCTTLFSSALSREPRGPADTVPHAIDHSIDYKSRRRLKQTIFDTSTYQRRKRRSLFKQHNTDTRQISSHRLKVNASFKSTTTDTLTNYPTMKKLIQWIIREKSLDQKCWVHISSKTFGRIPPRLTRLESTV